MTAASPAQARLCLVLAAVLWSLGSLFNRLMREPTSLELYEPHLTSLQIAAFRGFFAGIVMVPLLRRRDVQFRPAMLGMVLLFATMIGLFLSAQDNGAAANAIFLQNTAPFWVYVIGVYFLGDSATPRGTQAILLGLAGAIVIVAGGWPRDLPAEQQGKEITNLLMGAFSGFFYGGVILFLRALRDFNPAWLVLLNQLGSAVFLALFVLASTGPTAWWEWLTMPSARQVAFLAVFGTVQMAIPYWLFSRGLRSIPSQEAGLITLLEPLLNPVWAYLITPEQDRPTTPMIVGGTLILIALIWRYMPRRVVSKLDV